MDEETLKMRISAYKEIFEATGDIDEALSHIREMGCWQVATIQVIHEAHNLSWKYAKRIVAWRETWADHYEQKKKLDDAIEEALEALSDEQRLRLCLLSLTI